MRTQRLLLASIASRRVSQHLGSSSSSSTFISLSRVTTLLSSPRTTTIVSLDKNHTFSLKFFHSTPVHLKEGFDDPPPLRAHKRVVVTGLGLVTPLGCGVEHNWNEIQERKTGIRAIREKYIHEQDLTSVGGIKEVANVPRRTRVEGGYGIQYLSLIHI